MGLLDDIFGKEEISRLKNLLAEQTSEFSELQVELAQKLERINQLSQECERFESENQAIRTELQKASADKDRNIANLEEYRRNISTQQELHRKTVNDFRQQVDQHVAEIKKNNFERDNQDKELQKLRSRILEIEQTLHQREQHFQDREIKLADKSEKLQTKQRALEEQTAAYASKETNWIQTIEPQLLKFEKYQALHLLQTELNEYGEELKMLEQSLSIREADLLRRNCTDKVLLEREIKNTDLETQLAEQSSSLKIYAAGLEHKQAQIDEESSELDSVRARIKTLDDDTNELELRLESFSLKQKKQEEDHQERLVQIRQERTALRQEIKQIIARETDVSERESAVKRAEAQSLNLKNKNLELKQENDFLNERLSEFESQTEEFAALQESHQRLVQRHQTLKTNYQNALEQVREADNAKAENHKLKLLVDRLTERTKSQEQQDSSLLSFKVLGAFTQDGGPETTEIDNGWLGFSGYGPWTDEIFRGNLEESGYKFYTLPDSDLDHLIVGRVDWTKSDLLAQISARQGSTLRIYSQEMFFFKIVTGRDPFDEDDRVLLMAFAQDHPALQYLMSLPDPWPEITATDEDASDEFFEVEPSSFGVSNSPLYFLGYQVGSYSKLSTVARRHMLSQCFQTNTLEFSADSDQKYRAGWGKPYTAQRLYRIAIHIRTMASLAGRNGNKRQARIDWLNDLKWLKDQYYASYSSRFSWPSDFSSG
jgi:hypothetical protein